jgi:transcription initiation factor TFIIIB Brf1 subunit/transcription initiation factor TFIIB
MSEQIDKRENYIDTTCNDFNYTTKNNRSIISDLKNHDFPDVIKHRANFIYNKMKLTVRRANKRNFLLFFCVYSAYKELEININPTELGKKFLLTHGEMQKTHSMFSQLQTGYKPIQRAISATDYMSDFCSQLNLEQYTDELLIFSQNLLSKHKELVQGVPQTVAAGILMYFMTIHGIELTDKEMLSTITSRSETTILSMYKNISELEIN